MATVYLMLDTRRKKKNNTYPVAFRIVCNRKSTTINSGYSIKEKDWDKEHLKIKKTANNLLSVDGANAKIKRELGRITQQLNDLNISGKLNNMSITDIRNHVLNKIFKNKMTFNEYGQMLIKEMKQNGKINNANIYQTSINFVSKYYDDIEFKQITPSLLKNLEIKYLSVDGNHYNGLSVYMRTIRAIYNKAIADGPADYDDYPFRRNPAEKNKYAIVNEKSRKRAVSKEFIVALENYTPPEKHAYINAKYFFLFSFYMRGMNLMDIAKLKKKNIESRYLNYNRSKTGRSYKIKIGKKALAILEYYGMQKKRNENYLFPIIKRPWDAEFALSDVKNSIKQTNKYLRKIATELGFENNKLTTYVSRHSWATIADKAGIDRRIISRGLGHTNLRTTDIYIDDLVSDEQLEDADKLITE